MREYLQLYLNENKEIENIIQNIKKIRKKFSHLDDAEFVKKINVELFEKNIFTFHNITKNLFQIVKKENNILNKNEIQILFETNENGDFCYITGIEITKRVEKFEFNYTLSNKYINFRFVDFFNEEAQNLAVGVTIFEDFSVNHSISSSNKTLIGLLFMENIYLNKEYLKMIADALLLNKKIPVEVEDLILLNCDIDIKPYKNDSAMINILENNFMDKKENIRSRLLK